MRYFTRAALLLMMFLASACSDRPPTVPTYADMSLAGTTPVIEGRNVAIPQFPAIVAVREMRLKHTPRRFTDAELMGKVAEAGGRVIIGLKAPHQRRTHDSHVVPAMSRSEVAAARTAIFALGVVPYQTYRYSSDVAAEVTPALAVQLRRHPNVNFVVPDRVVQVPSDHGSAQVGGLSPDIAFMSTQDTAWGVKKIRAHSVWGSHNRGHLATVTIIGAGVDSTHSFYGDGPAALTNCLYAASMATSCWAATDVGPSDAGVVAARDDDAGYIGAVPSPYRLNSIRVCNSSDLCLASAVNGALDWAIGSGYARHIVVISPVGCETNETEESKLYDLAAAGALIIAASGPLLFQCPGLDPGPTGVMWPARYDDVLAVSGSGPNDQFADSAIGPCSYGSRYGSEVDLAAPFYGPSMRLGGTWGDRCYNPHFFVAAAAALLWTHYSSWSADAVGTWLEAKAIDLGTIGFDEKFGNGRVDIYSALVSPPPPASYYAIINGPDQMQPDQQPCNWYVSTNVPDPLYEWKIGNSVIGTTQEIFYTASSTFTLEVFVASASAGGGKGASVEVTVSSESTECFIA